MTPASVRAGAAVVGFALAGAAVVLVLASLSRPGWDSLDGLAFEPPDRVRDREQPRQRIAADSDSAQGDAPDASGRTATLDSPVAAGRDLHAEALRHPSESYRITSLLAVIRERGFRCTSVLSATAAADDLSAWRVSCEEARAYFVSEDEGGNLHVDPVPFIEVPSFNLTPLEPDDRRFEPPPR